MLCSVCKECLIDTNKRVYYCATCSPDISAGDVPHDYTHYTDSDDSKLNSISLFLCQFPFKFWKSK